MSAFEDFMINQAVRDRQGESEIKDDLHEALSLLDLAMHQGEYGVGEDVRKRYEKLTNKYKIKGTNDR